MDADPEGRMIERVAQVKDFFQCVLREDRLADWSLAKEFAEFLIRIGPDGAIGYALMARACRHLGEFELAREALQRCRALPMGTGEAEILLPLVAEEEKHLSR
jgi:hypothetical protein